MDNILDIESIISFISEIELQVWNPPNPADRIVYSKFISASKVIHIDDAIIKQTIKIRRNYKLKIPDAIIAASSIINNFILVSDNDKDFKKVSELKYINPVKDLNKLM